MMVALMVEMGSRNRGCGKLDCGYYSFKVELTEQAGRLDVSCNNKRGIREYFEFLDVDNWNEGIFIK